MQTIYKNSEELALAAADAFGDLAKVKVASGEPFRVALSGGSTPRRMYELLADRDLPWDGIHFYFGDERNVPHDDVQSNYLMVKTALFDRLTAAGLPEEQLHVYPVPVKVDDPAGSAMTYEDELRKAYPRHAYPQWDLALQGLGDDVHTASLFPNTGALEPTERWFVENYVEKFSAYRYTLTAAAINSAKEIWFLVAGSAKKDAMRTARATERGEATDPVRYPAQGIAATRWMVTEDAV